MSATEAKSPPDADKLKRLLALALDDESPDGEALNALKAARKIAKELGGFNESLAAIGAAPKRSNGGSEGFPNGFRPGWNNSWGNFTDQNFWWSGGFVSRQEAEEIRKTAAEKAKAEARARQEAEDAKKEAAERREWELKRAMGQGLPIWEAIRRRKLWMPGEGIDDFADLDKVGLVSDWEDYFNTAQEVRAKSFADMAAFAKTLKKGA